MAFITPGKTFGQEVPKKITLSGYVVDKDLFPVRTLSIAGVSVEEGFFPDRVTSCTASMIAAAGLGVAPVFTELMRKNGYTMKPIEDFSVQESGGLIARVGGDLVYVGPAAFMKLMGVRVARGAAIAAAPGVNSSSLIYPMWLSSIPR